MHRFRVSSRLAASPEEVWSRAVSVQGINHELGPWVRMTVIADPQGAAFTASKFAPENKDVGQGAGAQAGA